MNLLKQLVDIADHSDDDGKAITAMVTVVIGVCVAIIGSVFAVVGTILFLTDHGYGKIAAITSIAAAIFGVVRLIKWVLS